MAFTVTSSVDGTVAKLTLAGRLDANTAREFQVEIEKVAEQRPCTVALFVHELEYMASAGIRMLVFTKQKLGSETDVYVVGAQHQIIHTLEMTGVDKSVILVDEFEPAASIQG
ncbi:STAS domain-containing protein [Candidatus Laterigemmans baculatus]|uniref:STAS domain-containing protein n=1 Tax=Candidatus Laterigemmans baculatus TaxID=2770505 RepID=UPI0013DCACD2|nr:STAS domain-containing protein [Candidatus Laterigemmans baculatus]